MFAQMAQKNVLQCRVVCPPYERSRLFIGKMADAGSYSRLQLRRIDAAEEHIHIVIRFNYEVVGFRSIEDSVIRNFSKIRHHSEALTGYDNMISHRLSSVVRYFKRSYAYTAYLFALPLSQIVDTPGHLAHCAEIVAESLVQCAGGIHWFTETLGEESQTPDVIRVVVCHENEIYRIERNADLRKSLPDGSPPYPYINEKSNGFIAYIVAISVASARKTHKSYHQNPLKTFDDRTEYPLHLIGSGISLIYDILPVIEMSFLIGNVGHIRDNGHSENPHSRVTGNYHFRDR